jgi:hypothetical protein
VKKTGNQKLTGTEGEILPMVGANLSLILMKDAERTGTKIITKDAV